MAEKPGSRGESALSTQSESSTDRLIRQVDQVLEHERRSSEGGHVDKASNNSAVAGTKAMEANSSELRRTPSHVDKANSTPRAPSTSSTSSGKDVTFITGNGSGNSPFRPISTRSVVTGPGSRPHSSASGNYPPLPPPHSAGLRERTTEEKTLKAPPPPPTGNPWNQGTRTTRPRSPVNPKELRDDDPFLRMGQPERPTPAELKAREEKKVQLKKMEEEARSRLHNQEANRITHAKSVRKIGDLQTAILELRKEGTFTKEQLELERVSEARLNQLAESLAETELAQDISAVHAATIAELEQELADLKTRQERDRASLSEAKQRKTSAGRIPDLRIQEDRTYSRAQQQLRQQFDEAMHLRRSAGDMRAPSVASNTTSADEYGQHHRSEGRSRSRNSDPDNGRNYRSQRSPSNERLWHNERGRQNYVDQYEASESVRHRSKSSDRDRYIYGTGRSSGNQSRQRVGDEQSRNRSPSWERRQPDKNKSVKTHDNHGRHQERGDRESYDYQRLTEATAGTKKERETMAPHNDSREQGRRYNPSERHSERNRDTAHQPMDRAEFASHVRKEFEVYARHLPQDTLPPTYQSRTRESATNTATPLQLTLYLNNKEVVFEVDREKGAESTIKDDTFRRVAVNTECSEGDWEDFFNYRRVKLTVSTVNIRPYSVRFRRGRRDVITLEDIQNPYVADEESFHAPGTIYKSPQTGVTQTRNRGAMQPLESFNARHARPEQPLHTTDLRTLQTQYTVANFVLIVKPGKGCEGANYGAIQKRLTLCDQRASDKKIAYSGTGTTGLDMVMDFWFRFYDCNEGEPLEAAVAEHIHGRIVDNLTGEAERYHTSRLKRVKRFVNPLLELVSDLYERFPQTMADKLNAVIKMSLPKGITTLSAVETIYGSLKFIPMPRDEEQTSIKVIISCLNGNDLKDQVKEVSTIAEELETGVPNWSNLHMSPSARDQQEVELLLGRLRKRNSLLPVMSTELEANTGNRNTEPLLRKRAVAVRAMGASTSIDDESGAVRCWICYESGHSKPECKVKCIRCFSTEHNVVECTTVLTTEQLRRFADIQSDKAKYNAKQRAKRKVNIKVSRAAARGGDGATPSKE